MANTMKNLANAVTSDKTNLTKLTMTNANMVEQLKVALALNNFLSD